MEFNLRKLTILIVCCFVNANPLAIVLTFGTLYLPLLDTYNEDRAKTALVQSLLLGMTLCTAIIWGILSRKFGLSKVMFVGSFLVPLGYITSYFAKSLYQLIFCIGILSGIGTSIVHVLSSAAVAHAFDNKGADAAVAIHNCAIGIGISAYPFLMDFLLQKYGINGTLLLFGGLNLNNIAVTLVIHHNLHVNVKLENSIQLEDVDVRLDEVETIHARFARLSSNIKNVISRMMDINLSVTVVATGITIGSLAGFLVVILDIFATKGFSSKEGLDSFTVLNACSIIGRLLPVLFQLKKGVHPMTTSILSSVLGCAGLLVIFKASEISVMYVGSGLVGISMGGIISGGSVALLYCASRDAYETAFGLMITISGVTASTTGPLFGWMRDELQTYNAVIGLTAGLLGLGALLFLIAICVPKSNLDE